MLVEQLIRDTLELQGFRIESVVKADSELIVTIAPDLRYHPRCGVCGTPGDYRDTLLGNHENTTKSNQSGGPLLTFPF
jgi:hypothetical protein